MKAYRYFNTVGKRLETVEDYAKEARREKPLISFWGFHQQAGIWNRRVVNRRYRRHCEYYAIFDWKWKLAPLAVIGLAVAGFALGYWWAEVEAARPGNIRPRYPMFEGILGTLLMGGLSAFMLFSRELLRRWNFFMADVIAFEFADPDNALIVTNWYEARLATLGFADRKNFVFAGPKLSAYAARPLIFLKLEPGKLVEDIKTPADVFALESLVPTYRTGPPEETWSILLKGLELGKFLKLKHEDELERMIRETAPWVMIGLGWLFIFLMIAISMDSGGTGS